MKAICQILFYGLVAFFINACGGGGGGAASEAPPDTPQNVRAVVDATGITLSWNLVSGADTYNIYWGTASGVTTSDNQISGATTPFTQTGLSINTTYYYIVTAVRDASLLNPSSESAPSAEVSVKFQRAIVNNLRVSPGKNQVTLSWDAVSGAGSYYIYWNTTNGVTKSDRRESTTSNSFVHSSLTNGTSYYYRVSAVYSGVGEESSLSNEVSATPVGNVYYVSSAAVDDSGNGLTPATAKQTITAAIATATAPAVVRVNAGTYNVDSGATGPGPSHVVLKDGVSLYGGYNADFSVRDPSTYPSFITDKSTAKATQDVPNRALEGGTGISTATMVDGFVITGSTQSGSQINAAVWNHDGAGPVLRNNTLNGGAGLNSFAIKNIGSSPLVMDNALNGGSGVFESYGIYNDGSSPIVQNNIIHGGTGTSFSVGVSNTKSSSPLLQNNTINGGGASTWSCGVQDVLSSASVVQNNTIYGGVGYSSYGIYVESLATTIIQNNTINGGSGNEVSGIYISDGTPEISNNIIFTSGSDLQYCIREYTITSNPSMLRNNDLFACATALYLDYVDGTGCSSGDFCLTAIADVNGLSDTSASNNVNADAVLADVKGADNKLYTVEDNDWHFTAASPSSVTGGGLNGAMQGWGFTTDKDGAVRPAAGTNWSIGAYEPVVK